MTDSHSIRSHALLGGSSASRWMNCPGSVFLSKEMPPEKASIHAEAGTVAHEVAEMCLEDFLKHKLEGTDPSIRAHLLHKNEEMYEAALAYTETIWKDVLEESITGKAYGLEEKLAIDERLSMYGFVDFWAVYISDSGKRVGVVADFKFGYYPVVAKNNPQLAFYACALREEMKRHGKDLDIIRGVIFQPRANAVKAYQETKFTSKQLTVWKNKFLKAAESILVKKEEKFKLGNWCQFCRAQAVCPTYQADLSKKSTLQLVRIEEEVFPKPEQIPDETILKLVLHQDAVEEFLSSVKKYALSRCLNGKPLSGLKVIAGATRRKWKNDEMEIAKALKSLGIKNPFQSKLISLTDAEKTLKTKSDAKIAKKVIDGLCEKTQPGMLLVPADDPRPAFEGALGLLPEHET